MSIISIRKNAVGTTGKKRKRKRKKERRPYSSEGNPFTGGIKTRGIVSAGGGGQGILSDRKLSEQRHEGSEGEGDENTWEKMGPGRGNSKYKSLRLGQDQYTPGIGKKQCGWKGVMQWEW